MLQLMFTMLLGVIILGAQSGPMPDQAKRGQEIFLASPHAGSRCATCHSMEGRGRAVGPDIRRLAGLSPKALRIAIKSTVTAYVVTANLRNGKKFPALKGEEDDKEIVLFDLSKIPPVEGTYQKSEISSYGANMNWKHPPASEELTDQQLADLIGYFRFVAKGNTRTVLPEEVQ